jgi:hypothetical protein
MKRFLKPFAALLAVAASLAGSTPAFAAAIVVNSFDSFNLDGIFANWQTANGGSIISGPESYTVTATGYGSGFKDINPNIDASGNTLVELTVTLSGGASGPIVSLVDGDGTFFNYAWYGTEPGTHVLIADVNSPSFISGAGGIPGLDLSTLDFFHLQDDPGGFAGAYTVEFKNLSIVPELSSLTLLALGAAALLARRRVAIES